MASSIASMPGMRRTNGVLPVWALRMKQSTKAKNRSVIRNTDRRVLLNHCEVG